MKNKGKIEFSGRNYLLIKSKKITRKNLKMCYELIFEISSFHSKKLEIMTFCIINFNIFFYKKIVTEKRKKLDRI